MGLVSMLTPILMEIEFDHKQHDQRIILIRKCAQIFSDLTDLPSVNREEDVKQRIASSTGLLSTMMLMIHNDLEDEESLFHILNAVGNLAELP